MLESTALHRFHSWYIEYGRNRKGEAERDNKDPTLQPPKHKRCIYTPLYTDLRLSSMFFFPV